MTSGGGAWVHEGRGQGKKGVGLSGEGIMRKGCGLGEGEGLRGFNKGGRSLYGGLGGVACLGGGAFHWEGLLGRGVA